MAYGRIWIDNLKNKVTAIFGEMQAANNVDKKVFIEKFKQKYPKDYAMLQYEWEFKIHEYKKNRKGNPKPFPLKPDKILSNMYENYYFKLIKHPAIKKQKQKSITSLRVLVGKYGYKIKDDGNGNYNIINKETKQKEYIGITYSELKKIFSSKGIYNTKKRKEEKSNGKSRD